MAFRLEVGQFNTTGYPEDEQRVFGVEEYALRKMHELYIVHRWDGKWEDEELEPIKIVAWAEFKLIRE